jgi:Fe-S cluster biogenesis protein NfuA
LRGSRRTRLFNILKQQEYQFKESFMKEKVQAAIEKIRPMLKADGGDVELVDVVDGIVQVRLQGACSGCPMSQMTLKNGIERIIKQEVPEIKSVESV